HLFAVRAESRVQGEVVQTVILAPMEQHAALRDEVLLAIEGFIIDGSLPPGHRLIEAELARELDVSRNPVREALAVLAHTGWVDLRPRHGAVVHMPTASEVDDFFGVRRLLEADSAQRAAG